MSKLRALLLPLLLLVPAASSESTPIFYDFTVAFTSGALIDQSFQGSFSVDGDDCPGGVCDGVFRSTASLLTAFDLLSFDITVAGATFDIADDVDYPNFPVILFDAGNVAIVNFNAESPTRFGINVTPFGSNSVQFGPITAASQGTVTDIQLQAVPVPEPATLMLVGLGGAAALARRWRQRRAQ